VRLKCFKRCHDIRNNDTSLKDIQCDHAVLSIVALSIVKNYNKCSDKCINLAHYAKCRYSKCHYVVCCECVYAKCCCPECFGTFQNVILVNLSEQHQKVLARKKSICKQLKYLTSCQTLGKEISTPGAIFTTLLILVAYK